MAKGDVTLKFDANTAAFVQNIMKAHEAAMAAADSTRKLGESGVTAGERMAESFMHVAKHLGAITTGVGAAVAAIELVKGTAENMLERTQQRAELFVARARSLNQALAAAGQGGETSGIRQQIEGMAGQDINGERFSQKRITEMFAGVSGAMGTKISAADKLAATRVGLEAVTSGMSDEAANQVAINYARLNRERGGAGGEDLKDQAYTAEIYKPEGFSERDLRFVSRSKNKEQAMRLLFAASQSEESGKALMSLQTHARGDPERIMRMLENPRLAPANVRLDVEALRKGMEEVHGFSFAGAVAQNAGGDAATGLVTGERSTEEYAAETNEMTGLADAKTQYKRSLRKAIYARTHPYMDMVPGTEKLAGMMGVHGEEQAIRQKYGDEGATEDQDIRILEEIRDGIRDLDGNMRQAMHNRDNTGLKTNLPGQQ